MKALKEYTILYVDDEAANLRSFKAAFRRIYNVHVAENALEGMEIVKNTPFDLVVSDHKMPHLVGTEFLREVCAFNSGIRRVILSGFVSIEELRAANEQYGLHAYIVKPWNFENVQEVLKRLLADKNPPVLNYK